MSSPKNPPQSTCGHRATGQLLLPKPTNEGSQKASKDDYNPHQYAESKLKLNWKFTVNQKCCHSVKSCRKCHVTPLVSKNDKIVSFFVEHFNRKGKLLSTSVGLGGINIRDVNVLIQKHERYLREQESINQAATLLLNLKSAHAVPEMAPRPDTTEEGSMQEDLDLDLASYATEKKVVLEIDPALIEIHRRSQEPEKDHDAEHLKATTGAQLEQVKEAMKANFAAPIVRKASKCLEQLVLLLIGLQYDTSLEAIVTRSIQFLSGITDDGIVITLHDILMKYVAGISIPDMFKGKSVKENYEAENCINQPEMLSAESLKFWETMKQGIFTKHLSFILGTVFAFSACKIKNIKFSHPMFEKVMEHADTDEIDGMDLIDHVVKLYNWTSTVGLACLEQRSLEPMMVNTSTLAKCHEKYYYWHKKFLDFKRSGQSTSEERQVMFVEVETILKQMESFVKVQREKYMTLQASSLHKEVIALYNEVRDFVHRIDQVKVAIAFHLAGPPKCGKSTLMPKIAEQICLARGVPYRPDDNAQINLMSEFQDELNNATQIVTINESVPVKETLSKTAEKAAITGLALVDGAPFHPNRSNLEDKARITMQHIGVLSSGNTVEPFIHILKVKGAWTRRYRIVYPRVRSEFADEFGRIVSSKCDGSNDYHTFDVYEIVYTEKGERRIVYYSYNGRDSLNLSTPEFFDLVRKLSIDHFKEQDDLEQKRMKGREPGCTKCARLAEWCVCGKKDHETIADASLFMEQTSACTMDKVPHLVCPAREVVGPHEQPHHYSSGRCLYCGQLEPSEEADPAPEMGLSSIAMTAASNVVWSTLSHWVNPFIKARWLWSIDNNVMKVFHEELVEELSFIPDTIGCSALSLIPNSWLHREDGSFTWLGQKKDTLIRMIAAEKQIFIPFTFMLRRALFWGIIYFMIVLLFGYVMEVNGFNPRAYETVEFVSKEYYQWNYHYFFPQWSTEVMERREFYASLGVWTENYLDWKKYYIDLYWFQKILGKLCIPWCFLIVKKVPVIVVKQYVWWLMPCISAAISSVSLFLWMWLRRVLGFQRRYEQLQRRTASDPAFQRTLYDKARRHTSEYNSLVPTAVGVLGAIASGLFIWNSMRAIPEAGIQRDANTRSWSDWFSFNRKVAEPAESRNSSASEITNIISKNLTDVKGDMPDKDRVVQGLYTEPGILVVPRHLFKVDPYKDEMLDSLDLYLETNGVKHRVRTFKEGLVQIGKKDAVMIFVPKAPKLKKSIAYLLPKTSGSDHVKSKLIYRKDGKTGVENFLAKYLPDVNCAGFSCGRGITYESKVTKEGFCGAPIISDRRDGVILGFHISGKPATLTSRIGFAQEITHQEYMEAKEKLMKLPHYLPIPEFREVPTHKFGVELYTPGGPHPKTQIFDDPELNPYNSFEIYGHNLNLPRYKTHVRKSKLGDCIEKHFGKSCEWKAPDLSQPWVHHNRALKAIANGAWEVPVASLKWAVNDYWKTLEPLLKVYLKEHPDLCRPLTLDEAINGRPDALYMPPLKMNTSACIPAGSKEMSGIFERIEDYPDGRHRWRLTPEGLAYFNWMLSHFDQCIYYANWVKSCLKDEVVHETKEKVRIFYIMECVLSLACRMYYLPVAEFISRHPLETECMVGINCAGPEWEAMQQHIQELTLDKMMTDYDFANYDLGRPADVTMATIKTQIRIGEAFGYQLTDIIRMQGIGHSIRNPTVNWNGTIISLYFFSSGNSMTVYTNGGDNSHLNRVSYHWNATKELTEEELDEKGLFNENERLGTYGDDGESGSREEMRKYCDFFAKKAFFDMVGMGFTNAAKDDNPQSVVPADSIDFLKRKSVYHPALGVRVGALAEKSIWKMGHMSSGKGDENELAIAAIMSMLTESFLHGEEFYMKMREGLQYCAMDLGIWTDELEKTYADRVAHWHSKYSI